MTLLKSILPRFDRLCEEQKYLPTDEKVIFFRQTILQDLNSHPHFLHECLKRCGQLRDDLPRKGYGKGYNIWAQAQMPIHKHLDNYIELLQGNYNVLCESHALCGTQFPEAASFRSDALNSIIAFLKYTEYQERLREIIDLLSRFLDAGSVGYETEYGYGQALHSVTIESISPQNNVSELYSYSLVRLCDFASRLNSSMVKPLKEIQDALIFYQAGLKLCQMYRHLGIPACMPQLAGESKNAAPLCGGRMVFQGLYSHRLLARCYQQGSWNLANEIQTNDYSNEEGRISIITGFNIGGKTTFLQALGTAQLFMQLGFYVPVNAFMAAPVPYIGSLFANAEDIHTVHGRLEQELAQIREITTSEGEASDIMLEILHAFSMLHTHIVFVTHLGKLADLIEQGRASFAEEERALNYITGQFVDPNGQVQRTYCIRRGGPEKGIFEKELLNTYGHYLGTD